MKVNPDGIPFRVNKGKMAKSKVQKDDEIEVIAHSTDLPQNFADVEPDIGQTAGPHISVTKRDKVDDDALLDAVNAD